MKKYLMPLFFCIYSFKAVANRGRYNSKSDPLPIAISPLHVDIKSEEMKENKVKELGSEISKIIENNFETLVYLIH